MTDISDLEEKSKRLHEMKRSLDQPVAMPLSPLAAIIEDLSKNQRLLGIFGPDILENIGIASVGNDLRIIDLGKTELSEEQRKEFLAELESVIAVHAPKYS